MTVGRINFGVIPPEAQKLIDDDPELFKGLHIAEGYKEIFQRRLEAIMAEREEVLSAFIAKYGFEPDRFVQVEQEMPDGTRHWWVKRMTDEEMGSRSLDSSAL